MGSRAEDSDEANPGDDGVQSEARPSSRRPPSTGEFDYVRKERDLYRGLLRLNLEGDPHIFLREALELIVTSATAGMNIESGCGPEMEVSAHTGQARSEDTERGHEGA